MKGWLPPSRLSGHPGIDEKPRPPAPPSFSCSAGVWPRRLCGYVMFPSRGCRRVPASGPSASRSSGDVVVSRWWFFPWEIAPVLAGDVVCSVGVWVVPVLRLSVMMVLPASAMCGRVRVRPRRCFSGAPYWRSSVMSLWIVWGAFRMPRPACEVGHRQTVPVPVRTAWSVAYPAARTRSWEHASIPGHVAVPPLTGARAAPPDAPHMRSTAKNQRRKRGFTELSHSSRNLHKCGEIVIADVGHRHWSDGSCAPWRRRSEVFQPLCEAASMWMPLMHT